MVADVPTNASDRPATTAAIRFMVFPLPGTRSEDSIMADLVPESRMCLPYKETAPTGSLSGLMHVIHQSGIRRIDFL